ncbi:MAG: T9SS type A sorting domain-containing protein [Bacteroidia bacterium]
MKKIFTILAIVFYFNSNAQLCFNPATHFYGGNYPFAALSADFNADGKEDIAMVNQGSGSNVSVVLGTGTGSFGSAISYTLGGSPNALTSGDFNNDGKIDLAVAVSGGTVNEVSVLLGLGSGNFGSITNFTTGNTPWSIVKADFNGDGLLDLATANYYSNDVSILLGTGTGNFGTATNFTVGTNPQSLINSDFNGDGKVDLAVANFTSGNLSILLGTGNGSFSPTTNFGIFGINTGPYQIISSDFNLDGFADIATANVGQNDVAILLGTGTGSFGSATSFSVTNNAFSLVNKDFDGDGKSDLAVANGNSNSVSILLGDNSGNFSSATNFTVGTGPQSIISADLNGDGKADLVTANNGANNMAVLINCNTATNINFHTIEEKNVSIFPNPSDGLFFIEANTSDKLIIDIYDVNGRHVLNKTIIGTSAINGYNLSNGVYTVTIKSTQGSFNKKLIIAK